MVTQVLVEFTQQLYSVSEDVGNAPVALNITQGNDNRDQPIVVTVNSADVTANGK